MYFYSGIRSGLHLSLSKSLSKYKIHKVFGTSPQSYHTFSYELTPKQVQYMDFIESKDKDLVISLGPAGSGKTWVACRAALQALENKDVSKILITRPTVTVNNEDIGFLPGSLDEKFSPFVQPVYDCFRNEITKNEFDYFLKAKKIEICPLGFLRGRTFDDTFIIADEMQNAVISQTKMLLSRVGLRSKIVITGDASQCDLEPDTPSGLLDLITRISDVHGVKPFESIHDCDTIGIVLFDEDDCKRSEFVKKVIQLYK